MNSNASLSNSGKGFNALKKRFQIDGQTLLLLGVFVVLVIFFGVTENNFLSNRSISTMAFQVPEIGILTLAMMIPTLTGGINLSINATSNLSAVLAGLFW